MIWTDNLYLQGFGVDNGSCFAVLVLMVLGVNCGCLYCSSWLIAFGLGVSVAD